MSCSLAVFTTPGGVVGLDYAENERNVLVFDEGQLVEKVNTLVFDDDSIRRIGENARKIVEKYYSQAVNARKLVGIVQTEFGARTLKRSGEE
jgi:glycosyltransferase involved in cell wall biosynthesis